MLLPLLYRSKLLTEKAWHPDKSSQCFGCISELALVCEVLGEVWRNFGGTSEFWNTSSIRPIVSEDFSENGGNSPIPSSVSSGIYTGMYCINAVWVSYIIYKVIVDSGMFVEGDRGQTHSFRYSDVRCSCHHLKVMFQV